MKVQMEYKYYMLSMLIVFSMQVLNVLLLMAFFPLVSSSDGGIDTWYISTATIMTVSSLFENAGLLFLVIKIRRDAIRYTMTRFAIREDILKLEYYRDGLIIQHLIEERHADVDTGNSLSSLIN